MQKHRPSAKHDLSSSNTCAISLAELLDISESRKESEERISLHRLPLEDNDTVPGSPELRNSLAGLYSARSLGVTQDDVIITHGHSAASFTVFSSLLVPGDHVVCQHPVDERLYKIPEALGAEVSLWEADSARQWQLDTDELETLIKENTKMIVIQSPCDPTGAIVSRPMLEKLADIANEKNILVMADESFRPLFHSISPSDKTFPPSAINAGFRRAVVTGTISQVYGLAAIKVGWIVSKKKDIIEACSQSIRFASMGPSQLDEAVAAEAMSDRCVHALLGRNIRSSQTNLGLLEGFLEEHKWACSWVKPIAGTTVMIKFHKMGKPVNDEAFCLDLLDKAGLLICPANKCFGDDRRYRGYVRVAFGGSTTALKAALASWTLFMEEHYDTVLTVSNKDKK